MVANIPKAEAALYCQILRSVLKKRSSTHPVRCLEEILSILAKWAETDEECPVCRRGVTKGELLANGKIRRVLEL